MEFKPWMLKIVPVKDRLAVYFPDRPRETSGGILLPDGAFESLGKCERATVFAVGPEVKDSMLEAGVEIVYVSGEAKIIQELRIDRQRYAIIDEGDIQHILRDEPVDDDAD